MKIVRAANQARLGALGSQKILDDKKYRPLIYTTSVDLDEGGLLYNNLTDELLFLTREEKKSIDNFNLEDKICKKLIEKWYYVPQENIDYKLGDQVNNLMKLLFINSQNNKKITSYTIFPTTDCNARCFYCYENGIRKIHMSDKVAMDTADYIIEHSDGEEIKIRWFGGEPLYNIRAINIICNKLKSANVKFKSSMISNGYLFDDIIIKKAKDSWNLKHVQITLDGTGEKYNKIKAFIYSDVNAFERVIYNIEQLLKSDISVTIRMNMDNHNYENLFELVAFLCEKFRDYKNLKMYSQTLFDESTQKHMERSDVERNILFEKNHILNEYIVAHNFGLVRTLNGYLKFTQCMADDDSATTINPEGGLGKCEHFAFEYLYGSIYNEDVNVENFEKFKKYVPLEENCYDCPVRPACVQLVACPNGKSCNEMFKKGHLANVRSRMINTYNLWKKEQ